MVLNSQSARPVSRRAYMYRRRRRRVPKRTIGVTLLIIAGIAGWQLWPPGGSDDGDGAGTSGAGAAGGIASNLDDVDDDASPIGPAAPGTRREKVEQQKPNEAVVATPEPKVDAPAPAAAPDRTRDRATEPETSTKNDAEREQAKPETPATTDRAQQRLDEALTLVERNRPVDARRRLTEVLHTPGISPATAGRARDELSRLNERLVFSPEVVPDDPFSLSYTIEGGDRLSKVVSRHGLLVDWRFVQRVNRIVDPSKIREGQTIKLITGPFHAVVSKSDYRLDLYLGDGPDRVYVDSFEVGLGEFNSTPVGLFRVRPQSKDINPQWRNPRTGEFFDRDDPLNPIGEYWLGLEGIDENTSKTAGYGIHGTIDHDSIGQQMSMGCVRMLPDDVAVTWEVLMEEVSLVEIRNE